MFTRSFVQATIVYGAFLFLLNCGAKTVTVDSDPRAAKQKVNITPQQTTLDPTTNIGSDALPPGFSSDLSVSEIGSTGFKINWERGSDFSTAQKDLEYRVVYASDSTLINANCAQTEVPSRVTLIKDWSLDLTQASFTNLSPDTSYFIGVLARDKAGNAAILGPRGIKTAKVNAPITGSVPAFAKTSSSGVQLSWGAAQDSVTESAKLKYRIVKSTKAEDIDTVEEIKDILGPNVILVRDWTENLTNIVAEGLSGGTTYYFAIAVQDAENNYGIYAPTAMQTASEAITLPTIETAISIITPSNVIITWAAATNNADPSGILQYKLVKAAARTSIDSISEIEAVNGDNMLVNWTDNILTADVIGLREDAPSHFGILVKDSIGNIAIYDTITYEPIIEAATPSPTPTAVASIIPTSTPTPADASAPFVILSSSSSNPTNATSINFSITFSETIIGLEQADITVTNGTASTPSGSGTNYTFIVLPAAQGLVSVSIPSDKVQDVAGNNNSASNTINITYDSNAPTISITGPADNSYINSSNNAVSFPISGTCSESSQIVAIKIDNIITGSGGSCTGVTYLAAVDCTLLSAGSHVLRSTITDAAGNSVISAPINIIKDIDAPLPPSLINDGITLNSLSSSPTITFTAQTDVGVSGIFKHQARVVGSDGSTQVSAWADFVSGNSISGLTLLTNTTYKIQIKAIDNAGNESTLLTSDGWLADTTNPVAASALLDGSYNNSLATTPTITFTSGADTLGSGILKHQARVVANDGTTQVSAWADFVSGNTISGLSLTTNTTYKIQVKAIDIAGNESSVTTSDGWLADTSNPAAASALLDGSYNSSLSTTPTITFTSGADTLGSGILKHQARVVSNDGTTQVSAWADFVSGNTISGLSLTTNTSYKIQIKAIDNANNESNVTTSDGWLADTTNPTAASALLDGTYNNSLSTTPAITFTDATDTLGSGILKHQARVVENDGSTQVSAWADFISGNSISSLTLLTNTAYKIQIKAIDNASNESSVTTSDGWLADTTNPTAASTLLDGSYNNSLATTPTITFTSGTDTLGSGILKHQARVVANDGSTQISAWADFVSGNTISGLSLTTNTTYKIQIKAIDNLANESTWVTSDGWIADTTNPTAPTSPTVGSVPASFTTSPPLNWAASTDTSGSGVSSYKVQIYRQSDNAVTGSLTTIGSGGTVSGLTLSNAIQYYFKVSAVDAAGNTGSESAASAAWTTIAPDCGTPAIGSVCPDGTKYAGSFNGFRYFTTNGGCTDSSTPTCSGGTDTVTKAWGANGTVTNQTSSTNGAGNTSYLATNIADAYAAKYCNDMVYAGSSAWFLPASDEITLLYTNRASIGNFVANYYWSSSEINSTVTSKRNFADGTFDNSANRPNSVYIRCVIKMP